MNNTIIVHDYRSFVYTGMAEIWRVPWRPPKGGGECVELDFLAIEALPLQNSSRTSGT
jgi:hypothetical protein